MHDVTTDGTSPYPNKAVSHMITSTAMGLAIAGGICLFFGYSLLIDAPGSASKEAVETWFAIDRAFQWALRIVGIVFLIAAGMAWIGMRASQYLAVLAEGCFALLALALAVETTLEARADGHMDVYAILFLILAAMGASATKRSWDLLVMTAPAPERSSHSGADTE